MTAENPSPHLLPDQQLVLLASTNVRDVLQASWSRMSTTRSMSRGATGEFGSPGGTQNFSDAGSGWTSDNSRDSTVRLLAYAKCNTPHIADSLAQ